LVTPNGQSTANVIGSGGFLTINIESAGTTSGMLSIPASVTGGAPLNASMEGTIAVVNSTVTFNQSADTFLRDLDFSHSSGTLRAENQLVGSATFSLVLTRQ